MKKKIFLSLLATSSLLPVIAQEDSCSYKINVKEAFVFASFSNRQTDEPVMMSTIGKNTIASKVSNLEFPELMKSMPSVYASRKGGGYGDSRFTLRGFTNENVGVTVNGIPVNGMENGSLYWSNWAGLSDITSNIQVQRGIGLSGRAVSSVGGTVNIITQRAAEEKGGSLFYGIGNDGYEKMGLTLSTGRIKGWAFTLSGSRTKSDGYITGTNYEAWSYFGELSKRINSQHTLVLTAFGAPQWHNGNGRKNKISVYQNSQDGIRHNTDYGYLRGKLTSSYNFAYNEYHKPQISLSHYWTIDEKSSLTTSAYLSLASGGGQKVYGLNTYKKADGTTDFDAAITANAGGAAKNYLTMSVNDHDWYGLISNYNRSLGKNLKFTGGIDLRCYKGYHYEEISDLLGGSFLQPYAPLGYQTKESELHVGDKINSDYVSHIAQLGAFAELAYTTEHLNAFVSLAAMNHSFQREDFSTNTKANHKYYVPTTTKVGVNYQFANLHRVFVNAGYITRAPQMDNIYDGNRLVSDPILEKAWTMEGGYGIQMEQFMATMSAYYTRWDDKSTTTFLGANKTEKACIPNIDAIHQGIELEVNYRPTHTLKVGGFVSVGNWKWANNVTYQKYDNYNHLLGEGKANLKGVHVGDAPQTSVNLNAEWELMKDFHIAADFFYYARHYANFYPDARTDGQDSWQLPDYGLVDLRANYAFKLGGVKALLYGNVNNLFDKENIAEAFDGAAHTRQDATVWYGFGRTWSVGLRFQF